MLSNSEGRWHAWMPPLLKKDASTRSSRRISTWQAESPSKMTQHLKYCESYCSYHGMRVHVWIQRHADSGFPSSNKITMLVPLPFPLSHISSRSSPPFSSYRIWRFPRAERSDERLGTQTIVHCIYAFLDPFRIVSDSWFFLSMAPDQSPFLSPTVMQQISEDPVKVDGSKKKRRSATVVLRCRWRMWIG